MSAAAKKKPVTVRLTCHAPHPDPRQKQTPCGSILGDIPGKVVFMTTSEQAPPHPNGIVWMRCRRERCGKWNGFRIV